VEKRERRRRREGKEKYNEERMEEGLEARKTKKCRNNQQKKRTRGRSVSHSLLTFQVVSDHAVRRVRADQEARALVNEIPRPSHASLRSHARADALVVALVLARHSLAG
jgi:hypothetical protein